MRYMNWDVLIFPEVGDSKTPLQEFGTNCTVTQDPGKILQSLILTSTSTDSQLTTPPSDKAAMPMPSHPNFTAVTHPLPTVSSFIPSLLNGTPFRVSLHSWAAPVPSRATKAMAQDESMVFYEAKVLLDGICTAYVSTCNIQKARGLLILSICTCSVPRLAFSPSSICEIAILFNQSCVLALKFYCL